MLLFLLWKTNWQGDIFCLPENNDMNLSGLRLMLLNVRGLTIKDGAHNLTADVTSHKPDIAIITVTWLKPQYLDRMYTITY